MFRNPGVCEGLTRGDGFDGAHERIRGDVFEEISLGAGEARFLNGVLIRKAGEEEDTGLRADRQDVPDRVDTVAIGQADVEQYDVGLESGTLCDGFCLPPRLADHFHSRGQIEHSLEPNAHHFMVVDEQQANGLGACRAHSTFAPGTSTVTQVPFPGVLVSVKRAPRCWARAAMLPSPWPRLRGLPGVNPIPSSQTDN